MVWSENCMVSNHESNGLGWVWGRQVCPVKSGIGTCTLRMHIHVESVKQSFSIMIFVPVVEHYTLTVCLSLTNFKEPISQKDLWNFWFDKSLWKLSWVLHKIHTWNCELRCFNSYYPSLVSKCKKYSAYMVKFMNDCLMENNWFWNTFDDTLWKNNSTTNWIRCIYCCDKTWYSRNKY